MLSKDAISEIVFACCIFVPGAGGTVRMGGGGQCH